MQPSADDLTPAEAAARLKVKPKTIQHWLRTGRLRGYRLGRLYRIPVAALAELCADCGPPPPLPRHRCDDWARTEARLRAEGLLGTPQ